MHLCMFTFILSTEFDYYTYLACLLLLSIVAMNRYDHPCDRDILKSNIPPELFETIVVSYFRYAYASSSPGGCVSKCEWTWEEIDAFNRSIDWGLWEYDVSTVSTV